MTGAKTTVNNNNNLINLNLELPQFSESHFVTRAVAAHLLFF
jgi:hypothetical protein